jgi:two-component system NtrC family sensor kinase
MREKIKVLFVDDEQNVLNALERAFIDTDYTILTAISGSRALEILEENDVQVVVSDYRMPGMNGVEFLKEVRKRWNDIIRIVLSGYADLGAIVSAVNEGHIYKFIPKPWNNDELKITISNALERYFLYKENKELTTVLKEKNEQLTALNSRLKEFMEQQSSHFEFDKMMLNINRRILDSLHIGVLCIDPNNAVLMSNKTWKDITNSQQTMPAMPEVIMDFIEELKKVKKSQREITINSIYGRLSGILTDIGNEQKGIILVFSHKGDIL